MKCLCAQEMKAVFVWDNGGQGPATARAFNVYACDECGRLVKSDVWEGKGDRWIELDPAEWHSHGDKLYRFHWRGSNSKPSVGSGKTPAEALTKLGYGAGAVAALDYYEEVKGSGEGGDHG